MNLSSPPTVSVVIPTYHRTSYLQVCLEHLAEQTYRPAQVIVIDASAGSESADLVEASFPWVVYLRNPRGAGSTATSRAIGVAHSTGEVVAYIDDDAYARPDWLEQLVSRYGQEDVAGVGGRTINGQPGEESEGADRIGRFEADGSLTGFFAADPGRDVEVDHFLGANMSMRRAVIDGLGGIRDHYPGTCLREETDIALRARLAGYRLIYTPDAVVRHVAGDYAKGRRFDSRYVYYGSRNHLVLLSSTVGLGDARARRYLAVLARAVGQDLAYAARALHRVRTHEGSVVRGVGNGLAKAGARTLGAGAGLWAAIRLGAQGTTGASGPVATAPRSPA